MDTNQNTSDKASALDYELLRSHRIPELPDHIDTVPMERAPAPQSGVEATKHIPLAKKEKESSNVGEQPS